MYGQTYHCWKKKGHGTVDLKNAMKQSCDTYFYEIARKLGVDRLKVTSDKFGLGDKVLSNSYENEKKGLIPDTRWKKNNLGKRLGYRRNFNYWNWTRIYSNYTITIMFNDCTISKWWFKIYPKITVNKNDKTANEIKLYERKFKNQLNKILLNTNF